VASVVAVVDEVGSLQIRQQHYSSAKNITDTWPGS